MLITMTPGEPVTCSEHGELSPPADASAGGRLGAGVIALLHLRDVHGKDIDDAIRKVVEHYQQQQT